MSDVLEDLKRVENEKYVAFDGVRGARAAMERELMEELRKRVSEKYGEQEIKACKEYSEAARAVKEEMDRRRVLAGEAGVPHPVGTRMAQWKRVLFGDGWRTSGVYGVLEVFKKGDDYPLNMRYSAPNPGDIIVRILTKDGKPGRKFERMGVFRDSAWMPEGQEPRRTKG